MSHITEYQNAFALSIVERSIWYPPAPLLSRGPHSRRIAVIGLKKPRTSHSPILEGDLVLSPIIPGIVDRNIIIISSGHSLNVTQVVDFLATLVDTVKHKW